MFFWGRNKSQYSEYFSTTNHEEPLVWGRSSGHNENIYYAWVNSLTWYREGVLHGRGLDFYSPFPKLESKSEVKCAVLVEKSSPNSYNTALEARLLNQQTETFS